MASALHLLGKGGEHFGGIPAYGHVRSNYLAQFGVVDVYMYDLRLGGIFGYDSGHAVIETHSDRDEQVAFVGLYIGSDVAVHADHSLVEWEIVREGAESEHRGSGRDVTLCEEGLELFLGMADQDSLAEDHERLLGAVQEFHGLPDCLGGRLGIRDVAPDEVALLVTEVNLAHLRILGKVQDNRPGTPGP